MHVKHIDIKATFLHGDLDEDIYMKQPEGYATPGEEQKVCKLKKFLYGLKQAAKAWNQKIVENDVKLVILSLTELMLSSLRLSRSISLVALCFSFDSILADSHSKECDTVASFRKSRKVDNLNGGYVTQLQSKIFGAELPG
ncbi:hypothetical protein NPIL_379631 [Nephila pilipes]|uniref:Reverse transcriptase Ty1/copia-type domain-containing protein n=1 Tax=Nephila pilipes TaxID=299642 RepID=A0A8X6IZQ9_NEPPI|nr:hypothetical protein NPIL_379631 [Nephila pilipes]